MAYSIDKEKCVGCGACASNCPATAINQDSDSKYVIGDACVECGACESTCPVSAISKKN